MHCIFQWCFELKVSVLLNFTHAFDGISTINQSMPHSTHGAPFLGKSLTQLPCVSMVITFFTKLTSY